MTESIAAAQAANESLLDKSAVTRSQVRKRARISYQEAFDSDDDEGTHSDDSTGSYTPKARKKKRKKRKKQNKVTRQDKEDEESQQEPKDQIKTSVFEILKLPGEIRNLIYQHALASLDPVYIIHVMRNYRRTPIRAMDPRDPIESRLWHLNASLRETDSPSPPPLQSYGPLLKPLASKLLRLCRQIHEEAVPILYNNSFIFETTVSMWAFLSNIGRNNRQFLKDITLRTWKNYASLEKDMNVPALTMLADSININRFCLDLDCSFCPSHALARFIHRDADIWLRVYGVAKGDRTAAVEVIELGQESSYAIHFNWVDGIYERVEVKKVQEKFREELRRRLREG